MLAGSDGAAHASNRVGLYLSVATFAPRGEGGGGREPEIGWGERARV